MRHKHMYKHKTISRKSKVIQEITSSHLMFLFFCTGGKLDRVFFLCPVKFIRSQLLAQQCCPFLVKKKKSPKKKTLES